MLFLDHSDQEDFKLISVNTNLEAHQLAFSINKAFNISFKRSDKDLRLTYDDQQIADFIYFDYFDAKWDCQMYLVANKCITKTLISKNQKFLFDHHSTQTFYLLNNLKHIDYLIKIEDEMNIFDGAKILSTLRQINGVQNASEIDKAAIRNPEYLIFK